MKRGESEKTASEMVLKFQRENSGMCVDYYLKRGKSLNYARKKIREKYDQLLGIDSLRLGLERRGETEKEINRLIPILKNSRRDKDTVQLKEIARKIRETLEKNKIWVPLEDLSNYDLYRREVWRFTNKNDLSKLKHFDKRGLAGKEGAYHLDHRFSISRGYIEGIDPELIGSIHNLEFIPWIENVRKQGKCSITEEELNDENKKNQ